MWAALAPLAAIALTYAMINRVEMPVMDMKDLPVDMERGSTP